ncbi:MAG: NAD(P)-dependent oxidoreductase [Chthoniobacterales bacterium]
MARRIRRNVGIIGLGIIGSRVADNLRHKGFPVFVWNRTPRPVPNFVGSPMELAELCDLIQIFVSDDDALLEMVQRMKSTLTKQHIVVVNCTVSPDSVRAAAEIIERRGARVVDAPFTGSKEAAANGELVYYVGGDPAAVAEARPVLEASAKEIVEIGAIGQASAMKIATNIITAATVQAAAEALALVVDAAIPAEKFAAAMRSNGSNSRTLEMKLPKMVSGDLSPHFSVKHMLKDMSIASRAARAIGIEFGVTDAARHALVAQEREGRVDFDYCAVIRNFFPSDAALGAPQMVPERVEDQPILSGLDARTAEPMSVARVNAVSRPEDLPAAAAMAEPATAGIVAASESAAIGTQTEVPPPAFATPDDRVTREHASENGDADVVAATAAPAEPTMAESGGGLFRRFVRRGSPD